MLNAYTIAMLNDTISGFIINIFDIYGTFVIALRMYVISIIPGIPANVVIPIISPKNILYMSIFFTPTALNTPISFILDKKYLCLL